jgi:hypothetical protein
LNAQQKKEFLTLKLKAEEYNKVEARAKELEAMLYAERAANSRGAGQATDPQAERLAALREASTYDPASWAALQSLEASARTEAEVWLTGQLMSVPDIKRDRVAGLVRQSGYRLGVSDALAMVTDPETKTLSEKLAEADKEIARLRGAKANGTSPANAVPATSSADEGGGAQEEVKRSEYIATLNAGGPKARALMKAVGENKTKLVD